MISWVLSVSTFCERFRVEKTGIPVQSSKCGHHSKNIPEGLRSIKGKCHIIMRITPDDYDIIIFGPA